MIFVREFIGTQHPLSQCIDFGPVFICALLGGWIGSVVSRRIALLYDIVDRPDRLVKTHAHPVPYLGGVGLFVGFVVGILVGMGILSFKCNQADPFRDLIALVLGGALVLVVGITDDIHTLNPKQKLFGQILGATILVLAGWWPDYDKAFAAVGLALPAYLITTMAILTIYFMVLLFSNALNLLDGIDGLCSGVTLIGVLGVLLLSVHEFTWTEGIMDSSVGLITTLSLGGALVGFLILNRPPAKIFMGDAGSLVLGFAVAALVLKFMRMSLQYGLAVMVMFGLPLLDTVVAVLRRSLNQRPLFVADRGHLYDQMMDRGLSLIRTLWICYGWALAHVVLGFVISLTQTRIALLLIGVAFVLASSLVCFKGYLKMQGLHGLTQTNPLVPGPADKVSH